MFCRPSVWVILVALTILGLAGLGFLFAPGGPTFAEARLELGGALVSGVGLSGAFLAAERRLEAEDRNLEDRTAERQHDIEERTAERQHELEKRTVERQTRDRYQLALALESDLTDRALSKLNLAGLQLPYRDLSKSRLSGANLTGANLTGANLTGAKLDVAYLTKATLVGAILKGADLAFADLSGANLVTADLTLADLTGAKWNPQWAPTWPEGCEPPENAWDSGECE